MNAHSIMKTPHGAELGGAMKKCKKCGEEKDIGEFYVHKMMADGHLNSCKKCLVEYARARRIEHPERISEIDRKRNQKRKHTAAIRLKRHRIANPEKHAARYAVNRAIASGKLVKLPCEKCGNEKSQAHHHDYSKPLDVEWLCFVCHRVEHGQMRHLEKGN